MKAKVHHLRPGRRAPTLTKREESLSLCLAMAAAWIDHGADSLETEGRDHEAEQARNFVNAIREILERKP